MNNISPEVKALKWAFFRYASEQDEFGFKLGDTSKFTGCNLHIQQPTAARKSYTQLSSAAAF